MRPSDTPLHFRVPLLTERYEVEPPLEDPPGGCNLEDKAYVATLLPFRTFRSVEKKTELKMIVTQPINVWCEENEIVFSAASHLVQSTFRLHGTTSIAHLCCHRTTYVAST